MIKKNSAKFKLKENIYSNSVDLINSETKEFITIPLKKYQYFKFDQTSESLLIVPICKNKIIEIYKIDEKCFQGFKPLYKFELESIFNSSLKKIGLNNFQAINSTNKQNSSGILDIVMLYDKLYIIIIPSIAGVLLLISLETKEHKPFQLPKHGIFIRKYFSYY